MSNKITTTYTDYDENGRVVSTTVTETPYEGNDESCEDDENVRYQLTPKGIACLAMLHAGLVTSVDDPRIEGFWSMFLRDMEKLGYTQEG